MSPNENDYLACSSIVSGFPGILSNGIITQLNLIKSPERFKVQLGLVMVFIFDSSNMNLS